MIHRRTILMTGAALTGALGSAGLLVPAMAEPTQAGELDPTTVPQFEQAMPVPQVLEPVCELGLTSYYDIAMREADAEILPGRKTRVYTFNGSFPGPVVKAASGHRVVVRQTNRLGVSTSIHLHGAHVPQSSDGSPMDLIAPNGGSKVYTYPNSQPHANLWFHDHAHHLESETVYRGLTGFYLLTDDVERNLNLPSGAYDVPIALRDARFDDSGQLVYSMGDFMKRHVLMANGKAWPYFEVAARKYRFRLFNTANLRFYTLQLSDGSTFQQIGSDGGLLEKPLDVTSVSLSPGERADIVIDFSRYAAGTRLILANTGGLLPGEPVDQLGRVLQFRVTGPVQDRSTVPSTLRTLPALGSATVSRDFVLSMDETGATMDAFINGKSFDMDRVDTEIEYGATEIWTVRNANLYTPHNFHMHLVQFRVLERNGKPVTSGPESGLKDTVPLQPGETVKLQATFTGYEGTYVYHCHMFDHASMGMMANFRVRKPSSRRG
ncbi:multicopper oxidase domain-containing protein [Streptomyces sp. NBC_00124]|uniref:multicopper oxidase family protein n=1 Tax=Streptomyces sp. NBC_00124 TaxID=2975662 RepID=UPI00225B3255|nr:multicopper oxidase domain-containing protein [Streptomyces sp. NBC_00124]MCX5367404.1 multicopper oxidase domain-containing protein [Streptomyces sp. NBC_00124]